MDAATTQRNLLELEMREAVRTGGFSLHYQPVLISTAAPSRGFEALLRWHIRCAAWSRRAHFIPLAEETGLIRQLGELGAAARLHRGGLVARATCASPSTSRRSSSGSRTWSRASSPLSRRPGLPARRLELEITESVLMQDAEAASPACTPARLGRPHRHRRFRHRLFLAELPAPFPLRPDQDRPLLHPRDRRSRAPPRSCARWSDSGPSSAPASPPRAIETEAQMARVTPGGLHRGPGLPLRPAAARPRRRGGSSNAARRRLNAELRCFCHERLLTGIWPPLYPGSSAGGQRGWRLAFASPDDLAGFGLDSGRALLFRLCDVVL